MMPDPKNDMSEYCVIASGPDRRFEIVGGLKEGYGDGEVHRIEDVTFVHHQWQRATGWILGVTIAPVRIAYGFPRDDGIEGASEPGFIISGSVNVLYQSQETTSAMRDRISSLAACLAGELRQTRIYVNFAGESAILERKRLPLLARLLARLSRLAC